MENTNFHDDNNISVPNLDNTAPTSGTPEGANKDQDTNRNNPVGECPKLEEGEIPSGWTHNSEGHLARPKLVLLSDVVEKPLNWLWYNKIPYGCLSLIAGLAGVCKSFFTIYMADCVTNGVPWADGHPCEEGTVLFFYGEDTLDANKKRCRVNGVNQERVVFLNGAKAFGKDKDDYEIDVNLQDVELIDQAMSDAANKTGLPVKLVVIDPISNYWGKVSENSNAGVRSVLHPLQKLAESTGAAFVLVQHLGKSTKANAQQRVLGSTGITAACRTVWGVYRDPRDEDRRLFAFIKGNCGYDHTAVAYQVVAPDGRVDILETDIEKTADDIEMEIVISLKNAERAGGMPLKMRAVLRWLVELIVAGGGEKPANEVYADGSFRGYSKRTIDRAKKLLKIKSVKRGFGKEAITFWVPPTLDEIKAEKDKAAKEIAADTAMWKRICSGSSPVDSEGTDTPEDDEAKNIWDRLFNNPSPEDTDDLGNS